MNYQARKCRCLFDYHHTSVGIVKCIYTFILISFYLRTSTVDCLKKCTKENKSVNADSNTGVYGSLVKHTYFSTQYKNTKCFIRYIKMI